MSETKMTATKYKDITECKLRKLQNVYIDTERIDTAIFNYHEKCDMSKIVSDYFSYENTVKNIEMQADTYLEKYSDESNKIIAKVECIFVTHLKSEDKYMVVSTIEFKIVKI